MRDEKQDIDWANAPEWATHHAMDFSGKGYWYGGEPRPIPQDRTWVAIKMLYAGETGKPCPDWKDTLTKRPQA